jgi:hypothetical protein
VKIIDAEKIQVLLLGPELCFFFYDATSARPADLSHEQVYAPQASGLRDYGTLRGDV